MLKKKIYISIIAIVILIITMLVVLNSIDSDIDTGEFGEKIKLLDEFVFKNNEIKEQEQHIAILSISDNKNKAIVKKEEATSMKKAYENVKKQMTQYVIENKYNVQLLKVDFIKDIEEISMKDFKKEIIYLEADNMFRYGIIFEYEDRNDIILTEAELNSNNIINYDNPEINLNSLNQYLTFCGENTVNTLPDKIKKFKTISYFCDINNEIYEMDSMTGQRKQDNLDQETVNEMLDNATNYLINMVQDDGKFIYGYNPIKNEEIGSYNILRHAGSTWSMIERWDSTIEQKQIIDRAVNYLISTVKYLDTEIAYVVELKNDEIKLGGNALAAIAICEYINKFEDSKNVELLGKLGNGILSMQKENGSYIHVLNSSDFSLKDEYRTVYYDGEATFALVKLYSITKDKKYLDAAEKSIKYFIDNHYTQYGDHWISYAINEITKYIDKEEYYEFGLKNISHNIYSIKNKKYTSHTDFELLIQAFELYNRIIEKQLDIEYLEKFSISKLIEAINYRAKFQLNSYIYPEISMYLTDSEKYCNTFYIRHNDFRIRIDDIQHSILGYHFYSKNFEKIKEIEESL